MASLLRLLTISPNLETWRKRERRGKEVKGQNGERRGRKGGMEVEIEEGNEASEVGFAP